MKKILTLTISFLLIFLSITAAEKKSGIKKQETKEKKQVKSKDKSLSSRSILVINVSDIINPVTAEYIQKSIEKANKKNYRLLIIELDTPGGLDTSMRLIIKKIKQSDVPVVVYVHPSGARAASAGVFITMAAHIAAMTPGTNIGAAHPVSMGKDMDETIKEKATNDAVAYIKSIAEEGGRNAKWAEKAVRKSVSVTDTEAVRLNIVDVRAVNLDDLTKKINGKKIKIKNREITINTDSINFIRDEMAFRLKLLSVITNPNVAYILMLLGFYGLFFELTNPGSIFPGVTGGICLILAFYAFQMLPINYAGLLLIILAIVLFILEVTIVSHGLLTIGGIASMIIGSLMLFETPGPFLKLSIYTILPTVILTALFFVVVVGLAVKAWRRKPVTGIEGLKGMTGTAISDIDKKGMIIVHGELWRAWSDESIKKGDSTTVTEISGLKVKVKKQINN